jgi:hypothetical protein
LHRFRVSDRKWVRANVRPALRRYNPHYIYVSEDS